MRAELGSRIYSGLDSVVGVFSRLLENVTDTALDGLSSVVWNSVVSLLQPLLIGEFAVGQHDPLHFFLNAVAPMLMQGLCSFRDLIGGVKSAVTVRCLSCSKVTSSPESMSPDSICIKNLYPGVDMENSLSADNISVNSYRCALDGCPNPDFNCESVEVMSQWPAIFIAVSSVQVARFRDGRVSAVSGNVVLFKIDDVQVRCGDRTLHYHAFFVIYKMGRAADSGHCICAVRVACGAMWRLLDDCRSRWITAEEVINADVQMVAYRRDESS